jgi:large subunit ribosomal protein L22
MQKPEITFEARAVLRNYRSTAQKSRRVINLVRDKSVAEARSILKFSPQEVSKPILKLLESAVANILTKADRMGLRVSEDRLFISEIFADEGATMKRFRPRARGTAGRILKRTSHITVAVATDEEVISAPKRAKKDDVKKTDDKPADDNSAEAVADSSTEAKSEKKDSGKATAPAKEDPSKAAGKAKRSVGPKDIKATAANKAGSAATTHRKENMRKKGA